MRLAASPNFRVTPRRQTRQQHVRALKPPNPHRCCALVLLADFLGGFWILEPLREISALLAGGGSSGSVRGYVKRAHGDVAGTRRESRYAV